MLQNRRVSKVLLSYLLYILFQKISLQRGEQVKIQQNSFLSIMQRLHKLPPAIFLQNHLVVISTKFPPANFYKKPSCWFEQVEPDMTVLTVQMLMQLIFNENYVHFRHSSHKVTHHCSAILHIFYIYCSVVHALNSKCRVCLQSMTNHMLWQKFTLSS